MSSLAAAFLVVFLILLYGCCNCKPMDAELCSGRCGIHNISHPFRLKDSPDKCGDPRYNLSCEDSQLMLYLGLGKYYVKSINYHNLTIRLVDVGVNHGYSSLPRYSLTSYNFSSHTPYRVFIDSYRDRLGKLMLYLSCPNPPVGSSDVYVDDAASCMNSSYEVGSTFYVNVDGKSLWDLGLRDSCRLELMYLTSWPAQINNRNISCRDIHDTLLYGFELSWLHSPCKDRQYFKHYSGCVLGRSNLLQLLQICLMGSIADIKKITERFKTKLGNGGYGSVFKGQLRSGRLVAVKILDKAKASGQDFINEVATIGRIHHVNVVQLIGFCVEGSKRALIYEFMPNGSLEKYIFSHEESSFLSCEKLFAISLGVARGIEYMHNGCNMKILHFDIKPHNILLDENFNPKVSDFGLARLYPTDSSIVSLTAARGTLGYMAPELFYRNVGTVSYKADVYSFGMLLMEMAGRRKNWNEYLAEDSSLNYFPYWVYDRLHDGREFTIENDTDEEMKLAKKMFIVALWCIQTSPSDRPPMDKVLEMLKEDEELQMPSKAPYLHPEDLPAKDARGHSSSMPSSEISISGSNESI
ncbi:rust resistance kinase Lr10-like isoform X2 [Gastrolobium bilobum]|uniref:rust resistance kinase Lr10-like isoform X2 n=1 Tax=Gastrolobium bilobum TaxID=150636 RepID=UPI002AB0D656|nr:rust resistance kinase Lr10-like isoform X2 [Gastrolobium bilobum]